VSIQKNKGVHKFVLENPSNIIVYGNFFFSISREFRGISEKVLQIFIIKFKEEFEIIFQENRCMTQNYEQLFRHSNESPKNNLIEWKLFTDRKNESWIKLL
jgi:hypothetical protein